ncbi:primase-helicase family protein [Leeuwenhoekiella aequorea]|uniref:NrS-1 polymerase-like helicase domain-containing protein n=1 Tax=Leeuwenhoekiella aequorea TaxID=283736 RepID=A0A4Q0P3L5_9FLAO|nr:primase-helicase family protein [Leeuwenhoekiella aequorea]RXG21127.1 hypothetical protein DSM00_2644 [Leeuwenhoekiella aequorea]
MEIIPYIRVGTAYFKLVEAPTISGHTNEFLVSWNIHTIRDDHGKSYLSKIPKYDGFTCIPNHINFRKEYLKFYNTYHELSNSPKEGSVENSLKFLKHIFREHYELGLDYLQLLYTKPIQTLPILCLVSRKRSTGKSTFLKWIKEIFENNATFLTNDSFGSQFNADWANKLLIAVDEVLFNKEELTERIKYLSTSNVNKLEAKGKDKREVEFFGKFILCSNNEDSFIKIDARETRFWVRKIPEIQEENTSFLLDLISEIPAFMYFLKTRKLSSQNKTRMWFTAEQINTKALIRLVQNNKNRVEKEIASIFLSTMEKFELDQLDFCPVDVLAALNRTRVKTDLTHIRRILKTEWKLKSQSNSLKYQKLVLLTDGDIVLTDAIGRYFTISKDYITSNFDELMTD